MTTHLSARLAWHDMGWNGHICEAPHLNTSCIAHEHNRKARNDEMERRFAEKPLNVLAQERLPLPPCVGGIGAFGNQSFTIVHHDPLENRFGGVLDPVEETIPPYSCCPSPYKWMREEELQSICNAENLRLRPPPDKRERGWVYEHDRQKTLLDHFWGKLEPGHSLIFFYCKGNPLLDNSERLIIGVGRITSVGSQLYFGSTANHPESYPVWSRCITQDYPNQGVRIPYQEYLASGHSTDAILCRVPRSAIVDFSYVGEHVTDDLAVAIIERLIQSVEQVKADGFIPGDWEQRLIWLNDALAQVWSGRGPFPGLGSVLQYLGCTKGTAYQRQVLTPLAARGENPWQHTLAILEDQIGRAHV